MNKIGHKFYWLKSENSDGGVNQMPLKKHLARLVSNDLDHYILMRWLLSLQFYLLEFHSKKGWTATTRHRVTRKKEEKDEKQFWKLIRKNPETK